MVQISTARLGGTNLLTWIILYRILPVDGQIARERLVDYRHRGGSGFIQNTA
jgi:hypothetical protein